jgi:hypothetical protein
MTTKKAHFFLLGQDKFLFTRLLAHDDNPLMPSGSPNPVLKLGTLITLHRKNIQNKNRHFGALDANRLRQLRCARLSAADQK